MKLNIEALEDARLLAGMTKRDLAREIGVSENTIYQLFKGKTLSPKLIKRVCEALGLETSAVYSR